MTQVQCSNVIPFPLQRLKCRQNPELSESDRIRHSVEKTSDSGKLDCPAPRTFNVRDYAPSEAAQFVETNDGIHQIPHKIFEFMIKVTHTKTELVVFACLIRYTLGFRRSYCRASLSFIVEWTGLCTSSVRRGLESLIEMKLIRQIETGTLQQGSAIYEIPVVQAYLLFSGATARLPTHDQNPNPPVDEMKDFGSEVVPELCSKQAQNCAQNEHSSEQNEHSSEQDRHSTMLKLSTKKYKSTNKTLNKDLKTHSHKTGSLYLDSYFSNLKSKVKREREWNHFENLKEGYRLEDIADAVKLLLEEGTPGKREVCHSPLAFLSCSMDSVLSLVAARREKAARKEAQARAEAEREQEKADREAKESAEYSLAMKAFYEAFPSDAQRNERYADFYFRFPFYPKGSYGLKTAAIHEWFSSRKNNSTETPSN